MFVNGYHWQLYWDFPHISGFGSVYCPQVTANEIIVQ
jgi:hypothetical protein